MIYETQKQALVKKVNFAQIAFYAVIELIIVKHSLSCHLETYLKTPYNSYHILDKMLL